MQLFILLQVCVWILCFEFPVTFLFGGFFLAREAVYILAMLWQGGGGLMHLYDAYYEASQHLIMDL